jgi:hypothetical protein
MGTCVPNGWYRAVSGLPTSPHIRRGYVPTIQIRGIGYLTQHIWYNPMRMRARAAIRAQKRIVEAGEWKLVTSHGGRMARSAFPISSGDPTMLGRNWRWRVDRVASDAVTFRLLTAYDSRTEEFLAWLAADLGRHSLLIARYEFHGTHPGWHCHAPCDDIELGDLGALRTRGCLRIPPGKARHRDCDFSVTSPERAVARAFSFYRVEGAPDGALV